MRRLQEKDVNVLELEEEVLRLQQQLAGNRGTGRTYRLANEVIDKFFSLPKGSVIAVIDHYPSKVANALLLKLVVRRLEHDFPGVEYELDRNTNTIVRTSPTPREQISEQIARIRAIGIEK